MGTTLSGKTPATTFDALIKVGDNSALSASLKTISDGVGNDSPLKLSTSAVGIGSITNVETAINGKQATLVSGSSIKTINSTSVLGSGDISVQATLVSGTNIKSINSTSLLGSGDLSVQETLISGTNVKTINSTSLLGSGDVAVQETLVSGTNIKTINSTSLLGSGDISISASAGGSNTQIQFNDSGAFGADSLFNWDNTNKRLGVGETTPTARVHIKGEGSTNATSSLLVQDSTGTDRLKILDNGQINFNGNIYANADYKSIGRNSLNSIRFAGRETRVSVQGTSSANKFHVYASSTATSVFSVFTQTQQVGIGNGSNSLDGTAKLQIDSTTQGFLPPRMTGEQIDAIESPASGLIIYNTTTNKAVCYNGTSWNDMF